MTSEPIEFFNGPCDGLKLAIPLEGDTSLPPWVQMDNPFVTPDGMGPVYLLSFTLERSLPIYEFKAYAPF